MRFGFAFDDAKLSAWSKDIEERAAQAATAAVTEAGEIALREGRADIAASGLGRRHVSALRLDVFPKGGPSLHAAAVIRSKIPYEGIFETGGTISGNPLLWLPIERNLPVRSGGRRWTPARYAANAGRLVSFRGRGNRAPLLGAVRGGKLVPVFVGVGLVNIRKRLDFAGIMARAAARLPELFNKHLGS